MPMLHIREVSDLHLEHYYDLYDTSSERVKQELKTLIPPLKTDKKTVLIVAGDLAPARRAGRIVTFLEAIVPRFAHVIYVLGNHEHYNGDINTSQEIIEDAVKSSTRIELKKLTIAGNQLKVHEQGDIRFLCGTLWTSYADLDEDVSRVISRYINDHRVIKNGDRPFSTSDGREIFLKTVDELKRHLVGGDNTKTIVVTHHMPTFRAVDPQYMLDSTDRMINHAFTSDLDDFILEHKPAYWFFGHTHTAYR